MTKNYRLPLATNVLAMSVVLLLSVVIYPLGFVVYASTDLSDDALTNNLNSNDTGSVDPLSDAVLTFGDGTNVLNAESAADSATDTGGSDGADSGLDTTTSSSDSSSVDDPTTDSSSRATGSDSSSIGPSGEVGSSTGEVGSSTGEVGSSTGEVLPSDDATAVEIVPSEDATSATDGGTEPAGNVSTTDEGTAAGGNDDAGTTEQPITSPPTTSESESDVAGVGAGSADLSSSSSSVDSNGNALATESVTASSAENPNAVVQTISADGTTQTVKFGDVTNNKPVKSTLDKQQYKPGDTAVLSISDPSANVDPKSVNTIAVIIDGNSLTATEDGPNSGNFKVDFVVKSGGNNLKYDISHPQAQVAISGVSQGGSVQVQELPVSSFQSVLGEAQPDVLIGNSIQVSLTDGAQLSSNDVCDSNGLPPPCGGSTSVTMSYANAPLNKQNPVDFTIWVYIPGGGGIPAQWLDLRADPANADIFVDLEKKTVTANSPFGEGVYVIGVNTGGQGGSGGGLGLPGAGLVLDLIAPVVAAESPQPVSESTESTTSLPDASILNVEDDAANTTSSVSAITESVKSGGGTGEESDIVAVSRNGNTTIAVPGAGNVTLAFTNVISEGELTVSAAQDADLAGFKVVKNGADPAKLMSLDNVPYSLAGNVFVIGPTDSEFKGTLTVSVPYNTALLSPGSDVRLLHFTGSGWEDVTTQTANLDLVSGSLSNLGAVAPAVKSQAINLVSAVQ